MTLKLEEIAGLFATKGAAQYGREAVSQLQHALQCAHLAEQAGASDELVTAALLHDLGHLVSTVTESRAEAVDDLHQYMAMPFLRNAFPDAVLAPIGLHVDAKRYLCFADSRYHATLSPASQRSLVLQGGLFTPAEADVFIARPFATDAVALRRWDDLAKDPSANTPDWAHYAAVMGRASVSPIPA
jgi:phosphonate degradation associated HDIG domain protein